MLLVSEDLLFKWLCLCSVVLYCLMPMRTKLTSLDWLRIKCVSAIVMP